MKKDTETFEFIVPIPHADSVAALACNLQISGVAYRGALEEGGVFTDFDWNYILHTDKQGRTSDILDLLRAEMKIGHLDEDYLRDETFAHIAKHCFQGEVDATTDRAQDNHLEDVFGQMGDMFRPNQKRA